MDPNRTQPQALKAAACYARKSNADDIGIERQYELCAARAAKDGFVIPDNPLFRFGDDMTSGAALHRLDFERLFDVANSDAPPFEMLFVKDQTRFGRHDDPGEHFVNLGRMMKAGVRVTFLSSTAPYDPTNGADFLSEAAKAFFAREERQTLISRVTGGIVASVRKGLYPGNPLFGLQRWYACKRTAQPRVPVDEKLVAPGKGESYVLRWAEDGSREVLVKMFEWCADGLSLRAIGRRLCAEPGVLNAKGERSWGPNAVRGVLRNPIYMGDLIWRRERAKHPLDDPEVQEGAEAALLGCRKPFRMRNFIANAPITPELFRTVQDVLDGNRNGKGALVGRKRSSPRYLLSGLVLCSECGGRYHGYTARHGLRYYRHSAVPAAADGCSAANRYRRADALEPPVVELVGTLLQGEHFVEAAREAVQHLVARQGTTDSEKELRNLQREKKHVGTRIDRLSEELGRLTSPSARSRIVEQIESLGFQLDALDARERQVGARAQELQRIRTTLPALTETATRMAAAFRSGDGVARRNTVKELVKGVIVDPVEDQARVEILVPVQ